jgi:poly-gamma-glutamate capsule biosynthesis protein CapA/YwtB (metallophosphatase superfamily)
MRRLAVVACALLATSCASGARASLGPRELEVVSPVVAPIDDDQFAGAPRVALVRSATVAKAPIRIAFGGDVHGEPPIRQLLDRGENPLTGVQSAFADADIVMVNLETAVTTVGAPLDHEFIFDAPPALLPALKAGGVTVVNLGNNHSTDYGTAGLLDTIDRANAAGLTVVGAGRNSDDTYNAKVIDVRGVRIGFLGFDRNLPSDAALAGATSPGQADGRNAQFAASVVRKARESADAVVVMVHTGIERDDCPTASDVAFFNALIAAGASIVVGNHPHVLQGVVESNNHLVMYSNGNFVFYPTTEDQRKTGVLTVGVDRQGKVVGHDFAPAVIDAQGRPQLIGGVARDRAIADLAALTPGAGRC